MRALRASAFCIFALAVGACSSVPIALPPSTGDTGGGGAPTGSPSTIAADVVRYTNNARTQNGLPALRASSQLTEAARLHAQQMASYQRLDHTISGAQYPTMQSRLAAAGYAYSRAAENIAWNQRTSQAVVSTWMNSSGHRANILNPELTEIGAAMAVSSKGEPYWVQVFGTPR